MILGIGIDIIELDRIEQSVKKNERIIKRILTHEEREFYYKLKSERRKIEFLGGRFAAKEAFAKAIGKGIGKLSFQHINILPNTKGAPQIEVIGYENNNIFLSISHSQDYAVAQVVLEQI